MICFHIPAPRIPSSARSKDTVTSRVLASSTVLGTSSRCSWDTPDTNHASSVTHLKAGIPKAHCQTEQNSSTPIRDFLWCFVINKSPKLGFHWGRHTLSHTPYMAWHKINQDKRLSKRQSGEIWQDQGLHSLILREENTVQVQTKLIRDPGTATDTL